jgi:hypothetical protein
MRIRELFDPRTGMKNFRSRFRNKHPGSATLGDPPLPKYHYQNSGQRKICKDQTKNGAPSRAKKKIPIFRKGLRTYRIPTYFVKTELFRGNDAPFCILNLWFQ